jgi:hypothetical protein
MATIQTTKKVGITNSWLGKDEVYLKEMVG